MEKNNLLDEILPEVEVAEDNVEVNNAEVPVKEEDEVKENLAMPKELIEAKESLNSDAESKATEGAADNTEAANEDGTVTPKVPLSIKRIGVFAGVDESKLVYDRREKTNDLKNKFLEYKETGEIVYGNVVGTRYLDFMHQDAVIVRCDDVEVFIPESQYFEDTFRFDKGYEGLSKEAQDEVRKKLIRYQFGASVPFIVVYAGFENVGNGENNTSIIKVLASKKMAMEKLRNIYLLHKKGTGYEDLYVDLIKGCYIDAYVTSVRVQNVLVQCAGVETTIDAFDLSDDYVENCKDFVRPGDRMKVRIKKLYINPDGTVYLSVSGRLNDVETVVATMKVGDTYMGKVDHVTSKGIYIVKLKNGVSASVLKNNVFRKEKLTDGDNVSVTVTDIVKGSYVYGKAIKMR